VGVCGDVGVRPRGREGTTAGGEQRRKRAVPGKQELPDTLRRSSEKAQRTWIKTHDSAAEQYGEGEQAHRTAFNAVKHSYERKGDRWVAKRAKGPSDPRAESPRARHDEGKAFGGVDFYGNTKQQLYERARDLGVRGRSKMSKEELAEEIARKQ
jgi:cation transport regulator ChaB